MVVGPGVKPVPGYDRTGSGANTTIPYVMWKDTPSEHLMIPVRCRGSQHNSRPPISTFPSQSTAAGQLQLGDVLEPGPVEMVRLNGPLDGGPEAAGTRALEPAPRRGIRRSRHRTRRPPRSSFQRVSAGKVKNMWPPRGSGSPRVLYPFGPRNATGDTASVASACGLWPMGSPGLALWRELMRWRTWLAVGFLVLMLAGCQPCSDRIGTSPEPALSAERAPRHQRYALTGD